jgi:hypothetical protein
MFSSFFTTVGVSAGQDEAEKFPCARGGIPLSAGTFRSGSNTSTRSPSSDGCNSPVIEAPVVRNTFINLPVGRPLSMDDDFYEREVGSCPASVIRAPPGLIPWPRMPSFDMLDDPNASPCSPLISPELAPASPLVHWPRTMSGDCLQDFLAFNVSGSEHESLDQREEASEGLVKPRLWPRTMSGDVLELLAEAAAAVQPFHSSSSFNGSVARVLPEPATLHFPVAAQGCFAGMLPHPPTEWAPTIQEATEVPPPPRDALGGALPNTLGSHSFATQWPAVAVPLNLVAALDSQQGTESHEVRLELGSADMPTVGSAGHCLGTCKPCAFFHSKGCQNGVNCIFCHLCDAGEKRRRQKERKQFLRGC